VPTLYTLGRFVGAAMLDVDETVRFRMERVWLRSNLPGTPSPSPSCMNIEARDAQAALEVSCSQCRFDGLRGPMVRVRGPLVRTPPPPRVEFSSCRFRPYLEETGDAVELTTASVSEGVLQVRFYNCRFEGFARAMIQGTCGQLLTEGCFFDNQKTPTSDRQGIPRTGMDVALASEGASRRLEYLAVACSSQSGTFLRWRSPHGTGPTGATLIGVTHEVLLATPDGPETSALDWQAGTVMTALTLQGCAFLTRTLPRLETTPVNWTPIRVAETHNVQTVGVVNAWPGSPGLVATRGSPHATLPHIDLARADRFLG
jgi:hypothetical protein